MSVAENFEPPSPHTGSCELARFNALGMACCRNIRFYRGRTATKYRALIEALAAEHSPQR